MIFIARSAHGFAVIQNDDFNIFSQYAHAVKQAEKWSSEDEEDIVDLCVKSSSGDYVMGFDVGDDFIVICRDCLDVTDKKRTHLSLSMIKDSIRFEPVLFSKNEAIAWLAKNGSKDYRFARYIQD